MYKLLFYKPILYNIYWFFLKTFCLFSIYFFLSLEKAVKLLLLLFKPGPTASSSATLNIRPSKTFLVTNSYKNISMLRKMIQLCGRIRRQLSLVFNIPLTPINNVVVCF